MPSLSVNPRRLVLSLNQCSAVFFVFFVCEQIFPRPDPFWSIFQESAPPSRLNFPTRLSSLSHIPPPCFFLTSSPWVFCQWVDCRFVPQGGLGRSARSLTPSQVFPRCSHFLRSSPVPPRFFPPPTAMTTPVASLSAAFCTAVFFSRRTSFSLPLVLENIR